MAHDWTQDELIGLLTDVIEQNVRHRRSFVSASLQRARACLASFVDKHNQNEQFEGGRFTTTERDFSC
jgi:hypothetical protein